jgi:hypothetical protein
MTSLSLSPDLWHGTLTCFPWANPLLLASWEQGNRYLRLLRTLSPSEVYGVTTSKTLFRWEYWCDAVYCSFQNLSFGLVLAGYLRSWGPLSHGWIMVLVRLCSFLFYYMQQSFLCKCLVRMNRVVLSTLHCLVFGHGAFNCICAHMCVCRGLKSLCNIGWPVFSVVVFTVYLAEASVLDQTGGE